MIYSISLQQGGRRLSSSWTAFFSRCQCWTTFWGLENTSLAVPLKQKHPFHTCLLKKKKRTMGLPPFYLGMATWWVREDTKKRLCMNWVSVYFYIYLAYLQGYIAITNHALHITICPNEFCRILFSFKIHVKQVCISWILEVPSTKSHRRLTVLVIACEESGYQKKYNYLCWIGYYLVVESFTDTPSTECALRTWIFEVEPSLRTWVWMHLLVKTIFLSVPRIPHLNNGNDNLSFWVVQTCHHT